jgi:hypothetical protein
LKKYLFVIIIIILIPSVSYCQLYLGLGRNHSFAYRFNDQDINFSLTNPDNKAETKSYIENRSYSFWAPFVGYRWLNLKRIQEFRLTVTAVGAKSLLDKQDFELDPIVKELDAYRVIRFGDSRYCEFGAFNQIISARYSYGTLFKKRLSLLAFGQVEYTYRKKVAINWFDAKDNFELYNYSTYNTGFFVKADENSIFAKSSDYNLSVGINGGFDVSKYFALHFEVAQNILPSIRRGGTPLNKDRVYWETNEYFTSVQLSLLTYFSKG